MKQKPHFSLIHKTIVFLEKTGLNSRKDPKKEFLLLKKQ